MSGSPNMTSVLDIISDDVRAIIVTVNYGSINVAVSTVATVTNIINILVFRKEGFSSTTNISLFALAVSDLGAVLLALVFGIFSNPIFLSSGYPVAASELQSALAGRPRGAFRKITSWITALLTFERLLCVAAPLHVKTIMSKRVTVCVLVFIYVFHFLFLVPLYMTFYLGWKYSSSRNRTIYGIISTGSSATAERATFASNIFSHFVSFLFVLLFTILLIIKLQQKSKWRSGATSGQEKALGKVVRKEAKVVKLVTTLAVCYILCYLTYNFNLITSAVESEFSVVGRYMNAYGVSLSVSMVLQNINSATNIIHYYNMSTRYKSTLTDMMTFRWRKNKSTQSRNGRSFSGVHM